MTINNFSYTVSNTMHLIQALVEDQLQTEEITQLLKENSEGFSSEAIHFLIQQVKNHQLGSMWIEPTQLHLLSELAKDSLAATEIATVTGLEPGQVEVLLKELCGRETNRHTDLVEAGITQYDPRFEGQGRSACSIICVAAAASLLDLEDWRQVTPERVRRILGDGVQLYRENRESVTEPGEEHASALLINGDSLGLGIQRGEARAGNKTDREILGFPSFQDTILQTLQDNPPPMAMVFTSFAVSVCLVAKENGEFWLFDSHGQGGRSAFVERFRDLDDALIALREGSMRAEGDILLEAVKLLQAGQVGHPQAAIAQFDLVVFRK